MRRSENAAAEGQKRCEGGSHSKSTPAHGGQSVRNASRVFCFAEALGVRGVFASLFERHTVIMFVISDYTA